MVVCKVDLWYDIHIYIYMYQAKSVLQVLHCCLSRVTAPGSSGTIVLLAPRVQPTLVMLVEGRHYFSRTAKN